MAVQLIPVDQPGIDRVLLTDLHRWCREGLLSNLKDALIYEKNVLDYFAVRYPPKNWTLLHEAVDADQADVVQLLLLHKVNPNVRGKGGITPLHHAAHKGHVECVRALLEGGADTKLVDEFGNDTYVKAEKTRKKEAVIRLLKSRDVIQFSEATGDLKGLEGHLHSVRDFVTRDIEEALLAAILAGNEGAIAQLVLSGARRLDCALHLAIQQERVKAIAILLLCKATIRNDTQTIRALLAEPPEQGNVPWYMHDVHKALSNGCISMSYPIAVSIMEGKYDATRELLLRTVSMNHKSVDWARFKLTMLHPTWIYPIAPWVVSLKLQNNHLPSVPHELFTATQLRKLDLSHNVLKTIQVDVFSLPCLEVLNLSHNTLKELPETSEWTPTLLSLDLSYNQLQSLPAGMQYSSLEVLNLSNNTTLSVLPKCVCKIRSLTTLNLSSTSLTSLPEEMKDLEHLVNLSAHTADLPGVHKFGGGQGLLAGVFKARARSSKPCHHVKLVVLCHSDSSKTLICNHLKYGNAWSSTTTLASIELFQWTYRQRLGFIAGAPKVQFSTWLLGSGHNCMCVYPCVFTPNALYLLVWDTTQVTGDLREQLRPYLNQLACYAPFANILVACILGEQPEGPLAETEQLYTKKLNSLVQKPSYSNFTLHPLFIIPANRDSKEGFADVKQHIYDAACKIQVNGKAIVGAPYPESYFSLLLPMIERLQEDFAKHNQPGVMEEGPLWKTIAEALVSDSPDRAELPVMVSFLQDTGYLMHYEDPNDQLDQFYFLRPQWLFNNFLSIVRQAQKNGTIVLTYGELCQLTGHASRNPVACRALVRLMTRYIIVIPISGTEYLMPSLLPSCSTLPTAITQLGPLRRQFCPRIKALPSDIWYRLIGIVVSNLSHIVTPSGIAMAAEYPMSPQSMQSSQDGFLDVAEKCRRDPDQLSSSGSDDLEETCSLSPSYARSNSEPHTVGGGIPLQLLPIQRPSDMHLSLQQSLSPSGPSPSGLHTPLTPDTDSFSPDDRDDDEMHDMASKDKKVQRWFSVPVEGVKKSAQQAAPIRLSNQLEVWSTGLHYEDVNTRDHFALYPVTSDYTVGEDRCIEICTSRDPRGRVLLARLCRLVQKLLEERYPQLFGVEASLQQQDIVQLVPCPDCMKDSSISKKSGAHWVYVEALIQEITPVRCPTTHSIVPTDDLIPDYTMVDIPEQFHVASGELHREDGHVLHRSRGTILYEDTFRGQPVAIKEFLCTDSKVNFQSLTSLRKETLMLLNLNHPNILRCFAFCLTPPCLILEKAPLGNLHDRLSNASQKISRIIRFHIARQIASALAYLHERNIVYRTLKSRSILVWSLDYADEVSVKLANLERAEVRSHTGLLGGHRFSTHIAPEMVRYNFREEYTEKVDIYSLGILLYELVTRWYPASITNSHRLSLGPKMSKDLAIGYSTLVKLMEECWRIDPTTRPSAVDIVGRLQQPSFQCHLTSQVLRQCLVVRGCCFVPTEKQVWVYGEYNHPDPADVSDVTSITEGTQVFVLNSENFSIQASLELKDKANAIHAVDTKVLIGMSECCVHAYDTASFQFTVRFHVDDSVTAITANDFFVFVALANGHVTYYPKLHMPKTQSTLRIGDKAIITMVTIGNDIWIGCGNDIVILDAESEVRISSRVVACDPNDLVYFLLPSPDCTLLWALTRGRCCVSTWSVTEQCKLGETDLAPSLKGACEETGYDLSYLRLLSLVCSNDTLWVGLTCGSIAILKASEQPSFITHLRAHKSNVKCLLQVPVTENSKQDAAVVLSGGRGDSSYLSTHDVTGVAMMWQTLSSREFELLAQRAL